MKKALINLFLILMLCISYANSKAVLAGGAVSISNADVYEAFVKQASPSGKSSYVGVITAGTDYSIAKSTANDIISILRYRYGIKKAVWLPFHEDNGRSCTSTSYNSIINSLTGIFFNGGDTGPILDCFLPNGKSTSATSLIRSRYNSGSLAVFGSSAGSIVLQKTPVLQIQDSWNALVNGPRYVAQAGLGIFTKGFFDAHFSTRGRMGVFTRNIWDKGGSIGFGVDQDTAMVMDTTSSFTVTGVAGVFIVDVSDAIKGSLYSSNKNRWALRNVKVSYLTSGDGYTFSSNSVKISTSKSRFTGSTNSAAKYSSDIFSTDGFTTITTGLFRSKTSTKTYGLTTETKPQYRLDFTKKSDSRAYISGSKISYVNLYMDIYCVKNC